MPGVVIAGIHSGCGKTTVTLGLLAGLKKKGLVVQSFKAGPDFIDIGLHSMISGRPSRNLDLWMCGVDYVRRCFLESSEDADISIVEGVMGLYDGKMSTARLAKFLGLPVILVIDAYGMAETAGAIIKGFKKDIAGVIFNNVGSEGHFRRLKDSVDDIKVLGYLPKDQSFEIPERHLGLIVAEEKPLSKENVERLADAVLNHIDIETIIRLANKSAEVISGESKQHLSPLHSLTSSPVIAIAYDRAFCFYYEDNLDLLREAGAKIITFSPLKDTSLPQDVDALYIGGGYPELYAEELSKNRSILESIHNRAISGMPVYAECGGLMYLSQGIYDFDGNFFKMAGVFPFETRMKKGRSRLGYRDVQLTEDCMLGKNGDRLRGHEFHYSEIIDGLNGKGEADKGPSSLCNLRPIYSVRDMDERFIQTEGYLLKNTLASYVHIHFGSNINIAKNFVEFIKEMKWTA